MVKKLKIGAIIQARLGSTRLPHKVLMPLPINGKLSVLEHVISGAKRCKKCNEIIIATSTEKTDDELVAFLTEKHSVFFRGSEADVLSRFYEAATYHELDIIIRLTADNPFIDPEILAQTIEQHISQKNDYTRTTGLPIGMNLEVMRYPALKKAHEEATEPAHREHVTAFIYTNPQKFRVHYLPYYFPETAFPELRLTVDYPSDYALVNLLFTYFGENKIISAEAIFEYWKNNSWIGNINRQNFQKKIYPTPKEELQEAEKLLKFYDLEKAARLIQNALEN